MNVPEKDRSTVTGLGLRNKVKNRNDNQKPLTGLPNRSASGATQDTASDTWAGADEPPPPKPPRPGWYALAKPGLCNNALTQHQPSEQAKTQPKPKLRLLGRSEATSTIPYCQHGLSHRPRNRNCFGSHTITFSLSDPGQRSLAHAVWRTRLLRPTQDVPKFPLPRAPPLSQQRRNLHRLFPRSAFRASPKHNM